LVPEAEYTAVHLKLEPNDTLVLFSDGVTEAMDPEDELFGVARLQEALEGHVDTSLEDLQKLILESVENFSRGARQGDDVTILLVRYRAAGASVTSDTSASSAQVASASGSRSVHGN
jgi:sigma-B regulation protein RsbU (phosphoserine phosphatase)